MQIQIITIIFTDNLHYCCQLVYKKPISLSNRFFYAFLFDIFIMGDKMEDSKLQELINNNQNLIYSIIHKFRSRDFDDLYQVGCLGLIKAYQNFDSRENVKFTSYAYNYIVGEIYHYIINNRLIRMSPANVKLYNHVLKAKDYLTNYLGRYPTISELCSFCEIEPYKLQELENSMDINNIDDYYSLSCSTPLSREDLIDLKEAINKLTKKEKEFIRARYFNNYTQSKLASLYNTNQVKISREEKKILSKIKTKMSI